MCRAAGQARRANRAALRQPQQSALPADRQNRSRIVPLGAGGETGRPTDHAAAAAKALAPPRSWTHANIGLCAGMSHQRLDMPSNGRAIGYGRVRQNATAFPVGTGTMPPHDQKPTARRVPPGLPPPAGGGWGVGNQMTEVRSQKSETQQEGAAPCVTLLSSDLCLLTSGFHPGPPLKGEGVRFAPASRSERRPSGGCRPDSPPFMGEESGTMAPHDQKPTARRVPPGLPPPAGGGRGVGQMRNRATGSSAAFAPSQPPP